MAAQVEASRPDFDADEQWRVTKVRFSPPPTSSSLHLAHPAARQQTVSPDWTVGSGANGRQDLPGVKEGLWDGKKQDAAKFREVDPAKENKGGLYKMMISVRWHLHSTREMAADERRTLAQAVTPRPIGFLSTVDGQGRTNLAPFSYFNIACHDPPIVMVAFTHPSGDELKGTCENILETKEFVANM